MTQKSYQVLEEFRPSKHKVHLTGTQAKCIKLLKKGDVFEPKTLIENNIDNLTSPLTKDRHHATSCMVFSDQGIFLIVVFDFPILSNVQSFQSL